MEMFGGSSFPAADNARSIPSRQSFASWPTVRASDPGNDLRLKQRGPQRAARASASAADGHVRAADSQRGHATRAHTGHEHICAALMELCTGMFNAGVRAGSAQALAQLAERGIEAQISTDRYLLSDSAHWSGSKSNALTSLSARKSKPSALALTPPAPATTP